MTAKEQEVAAKKFVKYWTNKGYEKGESQPFWLSLLRDVLGVEHPEEYISFEDQVHLDHTSFIDARIKATRVMIEQKSLGKDLRKGIRQSDGSLLNPFQQAKRYVSELPLSEHPRWIITCNFEEFLVYDMEKPTGEPDQILLKDLARDYYRLGFLVKQKSDILKKEEQLSVDAGKIVGKIYDALLKQYKDPESEETRLNLNMLCVRLVFCLYAEDSGVFDEHEMFGQYLKRFPVEEIHRKLRELFKILNIPRDKRDDYDEYMDEQLNAFPYVNGGLFADDIKIPPFNEEIVNLLISEASEGFNWAEISPTIFGAVFESTLDRDKRRKDGMHYTSVENIHKLIDPLFLSDLEEEYVSILTERSIKTRNDKLTAYIKKLAGFKFFDPACGSGNFLTESYICLRRLENKALLTLSGGSMMINAEGEFDPISVKISQFYGIEINDFAVKVAQTALWIAEAKMLHETESLLGQRIPYLPLRTKANIIEGNALKIDWESVVPKNELSYILGNPPFVGYSLQSKSQKDDILSIYIDENGKPYKTAGKIDYVSGWYFKAAQFMKGTNIRTAFVSTNSITQGEQVASVWKPLYERFGIHIDFAYRTFRWDSEANVKAHVHVVIVGFSTAENNQKRRIYDNGTEKDVENINPYIISAPDVFIESRATPICDVPKMTTGNRPADGGHLIIEKEDYADFIKREPNAIKYIKCLTGAKEYINNQDRYCLWLVGVSPAELRKMPLVMERIELCKQDRLNGADDRKKLAETPALFRETKNPNTYIIVPATSSENRRYIPLGFLDINTIPTNSAVIIPNATTYHFGVLTSNVHMAWARAVCGRLEMRYRYSKDIVYNNFPWCNPTPEQKARIEQTAQAILDARALYPDSSLADLYDDNVMPVELRKAHQLNDKAVMDAYGFNYKTMTESECVAELMKMYKKLTEK